MTLGGFAESLSNTESQFAPLLPPFEVLATLERFDSLGQQVS